MRGIAIAEVALAAVVALALGAASAAAAPDAAASVSASAGTDTSTSTTTEMPPPGWLLPRNVFGNRLGRGLGTRPATAGPGRKPYVGIRPPVLAHPKAGAAVAAKASPHCDTGVQQKDCQTTASADGSTNAAPPPRRIRLNLGSIRPSPNATAAFAAGSAPRQASQKSSSILPNIQFQTQEVGARRGVDRSSSVNITLGRF